MKETSSVYGWWWKTVLTQDVDVYHFRFFFVSEFSNLTLKIEILQFHSVKTGCFVGYNAYYVPLFCKCNYITQYKEYFRNMQQQTTNFLTNTLM